MTSQMGCLKLLELLQLRLLSLLLQVSSQCLNEDKHVTAQSTVEVGEHGEDLLLPVPLDLFDRLRLEVTVDARGTVTSPLSVFKKKGSPITSR